MKYDLNQKFKNIDDEFFTMYWGKPKEPNQNPPLVDLTFGKAMLNCLKLVKGSDEDRKKAYTWIKRFKQAKDSIEIKPGAIAFLQKAVTENFPDNALMGQLCDYLDGKQPDAVENDSETDSE